MRCNGVRDLTVKEDRCVSLAQDRFDIDSDSDRQVHTLYYTSLPHVMLLVQVTHSQFSRYSQQQKMYSKCDELLPATVKFLKGKVKTCVYICTILYWSNVNAKVNTIVPG